MFLINHVKEEDFFINGKPVDTAMETVIEKENQFNIFSHIFLNCISVINKNNEITALEQKNKDYEEGIKELNSKIEKMQDTEDNKTEENNSSKEDISILFDENKISNKKENIKVSQDISDTMSVLSVNVNTETNYLIINLDKELSNLIYGRWNCKIYRYR